VGLGKGDTLPTDHNYDAGAADAYRIQKASLEND
jgi:hypothetical protein